MSKFAGGNQTHVEGSQNDLQELKLPPSSQHLFAEEGDSLKPMVRISSLYATPAVDAKGESIPNVLYAHSAWPTTAHDSVFFGPDTYRFLTFLDRALKVHDRQFELGVDVGTGAGLFGLNNLGRLTRSVGAGALHLARSLTKGNPQVKHVLGLDINQKAVEFARVNQQSCGISADRIDFTLSNLFDNLSTESKAKLDLVISNPPYMALAEEKDTLYAGGGEMGVGLAWKIVEAALQTLRPNGLLLLYTGVPISLQGQDHFFDMFQEHKQALGGQLLSYELIDPDVFGDDLEDHTGPYGGSSVGRIAVIGMVARKL